jgi:hypothetical protein
VYAIKGTRQDARFTATKQREQQQGSKSRGSIFKPHAATISRNNSLPFVATSSFSVSAILAGSGCTHYDSGSDAAEAPSPVPKAATASSRSMLWQPLASQPTSDVGKHHGSPWRQVTPGFSPAAMRYASQPQCSSSSSEQQPGSVASSSQSVRLRHTTPLETRQQQVQQQLRQSCQQLQELARLLSSPQQGRTCIETIRASGNSSAGSASRPLAGSSSNLLDSLNSSQHSYGTTGTDAAFLGSSSSSSSLRAALQAAEACLGLPAGSDAGSGLSTLQQLASAISEAASPSTAWTADSAAQTPRAQQLDGNSCISSHGSISIKRCAPSSDECVTPTAGARVAAAARVYEDLPVEAVSSPPPSTAAQAKHKPQQQLLRFGPTSSAAAAASAAASYTELLNKCQVSKASRHQA